MGLIVTTEPTSEPVSVAEAKDHLRITASDEDTYIGTLITAARMKVEEDTKRALPTQTLDLWWDILPERRAIRLPRPPLQSVTHVKYYDTADVEAVFGSINYYVDPHDQQGGRLSLTEGSQWPTASFRFANSMVVRYVAGYTTVPAALKHAMKLLIGHWYENREAVNVGNITSELTLMYADLIWPYKVFCI